MTKKGFRTALSRNKGDLKTPSKQKQIERPPADAVSAAKISEPGIYEVWVPSDFKKNVLAKKVADFAQPKKEEEKEAKKPVLAQEQNWETLKDEIFENIRIDPPFRGEFVPDISFRNEPLVKARFLAIIEAAYNSGRKSVFEELEKVLEE